MNSKHGATLLASIAAALAASCPRPVGAEVVQSNQPGGAVVQVPRGNGFGCPAGQTWAMNAGIAVCAAPGAPNPVAPAPGPAPAPPPPNPVGAWNGKTVYVAVNTKTGVTGGYITLVGGNSGVVALHANGQSCTLTVGGATCEFNSIPACFSFGTGETFVQTVYGLMSNPYGDTWAESGCEKSFVRLQADGSLVAGYARLPSSFEQFRSGAWVGAASGSVAGSALGNGATWLVPNYQQVVF